MTHGFNLRVRITNADALLKLREVEMILQSIADEGHEGAGLALKLFSDAIRDLTEEADDGSPE